MSGAAGGPARYRDELWRRVDLMTERVVLFVMLNPSTADAVRDDPTIRRCIDFAKRWGFGRLAVGNLWPYRATDPRELRRWVRGAGDLPDPRCYENDRIVIEMAAKAQLVVAAWGNHGDIQASGTIMLRRLEKHGVEVRHLGRTKSGQPRHPLYVPKATRPTPF